MLTHIKPYRGYVLGVLFATCLIAMDQTLKPFLMKRLIDTGSGREAQSAWALFIYYAGLQLLLSGSWTLTNYCVTKFVPRFRLDVAKHFMNRLYRYPYLFFQTHLAGSLTSKISDVFQQLPDLLLAMIHPLLYSILLMLISFSLLFSVLPIFALIAGIWVIVFLLIYSLFTKKGVLMNKQYAAEKSKIIGLVADYLSNMINVKLFTNQRFEKKRFCCFEHRFVKAAQKSGFYHTRLYLFLGVLTTLYAFCFMAALIFASQKGDLSPGDFALVTMTNFNIINILYQVSHTLGNFIVNWGAVDQAIALLEKSENISLDQPNAKRLTCTQGHILFNRVKFHYEETEALFQNKSIEIQAKQKVGLVGHSGSGKSTFVNLVLRMYDVIDGAILIDGQDIRDIAQDSLRANIGVIPQDPLLFHRSLMENIRYGRVDATDEEVMKAAKQAHAHTFIANLPQGYDSIVGERGVKLSGGERQRIAIARAILKNAPILILDEATSQLDSITEGLIQQSLRNLMEDKTTLIIAHRLSTLLHIDRILVFDQGKIVEDGAHDQLMTKNGAYRALWEAQVGELLENEAHYIL